MVSRSKTIESDKSTTYGDVIAEDATDVVPTIEGEGFGTPNLSTC